MDIGSIFLILALLVIVGVFISRPFFEPEGKMVNSSNYGRSSLRFRSRRSETALSEEEHQFSALLAERDRLLNALHELDFDHTLGKIPEEDYPQQRAILLQRGADVLRKLDAMQKDSIEDDAEARLEAAIAARRADARQTPKNGQQPSDGQEAVQQAVAVTVPNASPDDALEIMLANRRRERQEKASGFCHKCGGPLQKSDQFCPKCGTRL